MSRTIAGEYFPEDSYSLEWTAFILIFLAGAVVLWLSAHRPPPFIPPPISAPSAGMDRFMVLWMPEVPMAPQQTERMRARYDQWLRALSDNGYHPLLLSDVARRYVEGVGLPDHAVVIVFDPGYRHTFETVSPIFMRYRIPAVWYINQADLLRDERRTVHSHMVREMQESKYWDVGFHEVMKDWKFTPSTSEIIKVNGLTTQWASGAGHTARNVGTDLSVLNGLHVGTTWTGDDLVNRLAMESSLQSPAYLTVKPVQHYLWGVVAEHPKGRSQFTLHAPLQETSRSLFWLGTKDCPDFILTADVEALFGEVFFWLRSSPDKTEGIGVGLGHKMLYIDLLQAGKRQRLATVPISHADQESAWLLIMLQGDKLNVSLEGHSLIRLENAAFLASPQGIIRMTVYDKIRGAAKLDVRQMQIFPILKPALKTTLASSTS